MKVRQDDKGLYIVNARGSGHYRPGEVPAYAHAYDMSDGVIGWSFQCVTPGLKNLKAMIYND